MSLFPFYPTKFHFLLQVNGEKMYDKARRGETIELSPRRISIFQFDIERSLDDRCLLYQFSLWIHDINSPSVDLAPHDIHFINTPSDTHGLGT